MEKTKTERRGAKSTRQGTEAFILNMVVREVFTK